MGSKRPRIVRVVRKAAKEGCHHLLGRILRHADCAQTLYDAGWLEGAFLFALLGFEELGKLIQLVDAARTAEAEGSDIFEVGGFLDHGDKARQSAASVALSFDFLIAPLKDAGLKTAEFDEYLGHLAAIKKDFERLRGGMMYVDYDGAWALEKAPPQDLIYMDINVLFFASAIILVSLEKTTDFRAFTDEFDQLKEQVKEELPQLIEKVRATERGELKGPPN